MSVSASQNWGPAMPHAGQIAKSAPLTAEVSRDFAALRPLWESMTREGHATAYQGYGFCEPYFRHVASMEGSEAALIVMRNAAGEAVALLPLAVEAVGPMRVAQFLGGKQSNFNMPVFGASADRVTPDALRDVLVEAGRAAGIDLFALHAQPRAWQGFANPLAALDPQPSPSNGYKLQLGADADEVLKRQLSKDSRKKLRQKEQKLGLIGTVSYRRPTGRAEIDAAFAAFLKLKAERFASQGITDPFSAPAIQTFLAETMMDRADGPAALELHTLAVADRVVAIFGVLVSADRLSGLFTAFDSDPDIARCSPGDILLTYMIRNACARGLKTFDLGVGEAHYKDKICDEAEVLVESFLPVTLLGRIGAVAFRSKQTVKRLIKTSAYGQRAIALLRSLKTR